MFNKIRDIVHKFKKSNTHKIYNIDNFVINNNIRKIINKRLLEYRSEFNRQMRNEGIATDNGMLLYILPLFEELKYYYNNDLCISVAECITISENASYDLRIHSYHYENAILRIARAWEYLSIILNEFLQTGLVAGYDIKNQLIEFACGEIEFKKEGKGYKIVTHSCSEDVRESIEKQMKKDKKVLQISQNNRNNSLLKTIKKKYAITDNIQCILDLYKCNEVKEIISLRNEILHRRPLSARFSLAKGDIFPGQCVDINPNGWCDIKKLPIIIEKSTYAIKEAIEILHMIIFYNEVPNSKKNKDVQFKCYEAKCNNCNSDMLINEIIVEIFNRSNNYILCPKCKSKDTIIKGKKVVNERYYFSNFKEYYNDIFNNEVYD